MYRIASISASVGVALSKRKKKARSAPSAPRTATAPASTTARHFVRCMVEGDAGETGIVLEAGCGYRPATGEAAGG